MEHTAWLLMAALRARMKEADLLPRGAPTLTSLLDYVALGTVADCVSPGASRNNRAVVRYGLGMITRGCRPCWKAIRKRGWLSAPTVSARDLAFAIGPRINARGRLDEAMTGVMFLIAQTTEEADDFARVLENENEERKGIERELVEDAVAQADSMLAQGAGGLALWLERGHPFVHGIVASRIVERHGHPVVCLSPQCGSEDLVAGSARSVDGLSLIGVLRTIDRQHPGLFVKFGGHAMAAGLTISRDDIGEFQSAFSVAVG